MCRYPDKHFDLAIVDPPYGNGGNSADHISRIGGSWSAKYGNHINNWDKAPSAEYFSELFRVSKYQIIWGGNYFPLPPSRNFIIWRKLSISENFSMAMCEYAWTSIRGNARIYECVPQDKNRFHPTQKPVLLYKWLLSRYAEKGWGILDTHMGSGSIAIACYDLGYELTACEIYKGYYDAAMQRIENHLKQLKLPFVEGAIPSHIKMEL
jgi:site-specific DNA-methyltransferase (adenine-specific)